MKINSFFAFSFLGLLGVNAQDWKDIPVPADAGEKKHWVLQEDVSDDFNYTFDAANKKVNFGKDNKWYNFYHNGWDGPGTTYWKYNHISVDGNDLVVKASRRNIENEPNPKSSRPAKMGKTGEGINAGCITSNKKVKYPVFVESKISVANIALASDVWLLSPDDTQEIDIIECYGGAGSGNAYFSKFIHLSHHSFIRKPFTDYQPRDHNSWWNIAGVKSWGEYCWNNGDRKYVRVGVNWISPKHFEYYVDGELQRVLYHGAFATKKGATWHYTYPTMKDGKLEFEKGYQKVVEYQTSENYDFNILKEQGLLSEVSTVDPYKYQGGKGFTKAMDIIINVESQSWHVADGRTPNDEILADTSKNTVKVDWIRVYKPLDGKQKRRMKKEKRRRSKNKVK